MNEEIFISTRIRSRNQALLQNLLQVGCIINRIDHCVEQSLYVNCVPLHNIAVVQKQQPHKLTDRTAIAFPERMNIVQLCHVVSAASYKRLKGHVFQPFFLLQLT